MKIAIIADIHGAAAPLERVLNWLTPKQPDLILLLGDLLNHGPRNALPESYAPLRVAELLNQQAEKIIAVRGNCDSEVDQMLLNFPILAPHNQLLVAGRRWFLCHGHLASVDSIPLPPNSLWLSGHTHLAELRADSMRIYVNPGSIAIPRGSHPATFGWYEDEQLNLIEVNSGKCFATLQLVSQN